LPESGLREYRTRNAELATVISNIKPTQKILFYNTIEAIVFFPSDNYSQYLLMPGLFEAGDKNSIFDNSNDFILIDNASKEINLIPPCYDRELVSRYTLFKKTPSCKGESVTKQ